MKLLGKIFKIHPSKNKLNELLELSEIMEQN